MRYYTTKPMTGGVLFKCVYCEHTVTTPDFDEAKGNRRTQAAAAIHQHAKELHANQVRAAESIKPGCYGVV